MIAIPDAEMGDHDGPPYPQADARTGGDADRWLGRVRRLGVAGREDFGQVGEHRSGTFTPSKSSDPVE
jgi:hypothetical protein